MMDVDVIIESVTSAGLLGQEAFARAMIEPLLPTFIGLFLVIFVSQIILTLILVEQGFIKMTIVIGLPLVLGVIYLVFSTLTPVIPTLTMGWSMLVGILG